ncbi:MAG: S41 family peptidase [Burkholderia sp.]|nr:S41 family peptidase [Burkholderia sp.]
MRIKLKDIGLTIIGLAAGVLATLQISTSAIQNTISPLSFDQLRLFAEVFSWIKYEYVDQVDDKKLLTSAIKGMVSSLDPHSAFLSEADYKELEQETKGCFTGIGIEIVQESNLLKVVSLINDTPAFRAGIRTGDLITRINNKPVLGMKIDNLVKHMRGEPGTKVTLTIYRKSEDRIFQVTVTRAIIKIKSVKMKLLKPGYAYVRITSFQEQTTIDLANRLQDINHYYPNLKGLILDLRDNSGGLLQSAVGVASAFLPPNSVVVSTKGKISDFNKIYLDTFDNYSLPNFTSDPLKKLPDIFKKVPLVVLTNAYSASASEIVSGALQDSKRAIIMGKTTFGKGSVQTVRPMTNKTGLRLTTAYYYTPNGRSIQNKGIVPNILVDQYRDGDPDDIFIMREIDYINHLDNTQDPNEKNKLNERDQRRLDCLLILEKQNNKNNRKIFKQDKDRKFIEFGSEDDFMLQQALNKLQGKFVKESKSSALR